MIDPRIEAPEGYCRFAGANKRGGPLVRAGKEITLYPNRSGSPSPPPSRHRSVEKVLSRCVSRLRLPDCVKLRRRVTASTMTAEDDKDREQLETAASTPTSQQAPKTTKDRSCPFCGQAFTSSSLGRHLDLYIKPKNPKPPDGVHDVGEIKRLRGGITRRQPKTSLKASTSNDNAVSSKEGTPSGAPAPGRPHTNFRSQYTNESPLASPVNARPGNSVRSRFNAPNWQATGVINNLPPRTSSRIDGAPPSGQAHRIQEMRRDKAGNKVQRPDHENDGMLKLQEAAEVGRTAELALREVLSSLEAAKKKTDPKLIFDDVDFFSMSFPGLCLAILPTPSTLHTPIPFPSGDSWSLSPPGQKQYEALHRLMQERTREIYQADPSRLTDSVIFRHNVHLQGAYEHWQCMPEQDRASAWSLETLRAYAKAAEGKSQLRQEVEASQHRVRHLEAEYERLSRCQLPREYLMHPPSTLPTPAAVLKELHIAKPGSGAAEMEYDVDTLLEKWRAAVKATRRRPQAPPATTSPTMYDPDRGCRDAPHITQDLIMNGSVWAVDGALPRDVGRSYRISDNEHVDYETPPNPGAIVDAEEGDRASSAGVDGETDADADGDADDDGRGGQVVLAAQRAQLQYPSTRGNEVNLNGKRSLAQGSTNSRQKWLKHTKN